MAGTDPYRWNENDCSARVTLSNGDLTATKTSSLLTGNVRSVGSKNSGKSYWELYINGASTTYSFMGCGWCDANHALYYGIGQDANDLGMGARIQEYTYHKGGLQVGADGINAGAGDYVMIAMDHDAGKCWFGKNNTWRNGDPATGNDPSIEDAGYAGAALFPAVSLFDYHADQVTIRTTEAAMSGTIPDGFIPVNGVAPGTRYTIGFTAGIKFGAKVGGRDLTQWLASNPGRRTYRYHARMTGSGQADYALPGCRSISLRMQASYDWWLGQPSSLQLVLPWSQALVNALADREHADIVLEMATRIGGVEVLREPIVVVDFSSVRTDLGPVNKSVTINGRRRTANNAAAVALASVETLTYLADGRITVTCAAPDWRIRPGNRVSYAGQTWQVGTVVWSGNYRRMTMTVTEIKTPWEA
jgi:hypothetical protein